MEPPEKKKKKKKIQGQQLPDDIWNQILLHLPAKAVIKLKSVCKSWCQLINNKNFQISHFDHWRRISFSTETKSQLVTVCQSAPPALLSFEPAVSNDIPSKLRCRPLRFDQPLLLRPSQRPLCVLHSHDGLLLICTKKNRLFLFNPLTKSYLYLPFPEINCTFIHYWTWTFVYDPSSRSYVIFCVDFSYTRPSGTVYLYSLRIELNEFLSGQKIRGWRVWSPEKQTLNTTGGGGGARSFFFRASISIHVKAYFLFTFDCDDMILSTGILTIDAVTEESILTKCSGPNPALAVFFQSSREFYGLNESSSSVEALELWVIDDVDNPTWSKRHIIIKPTFYHHIRIIPSSYLGILKEGDRLIIHSSPGKSVFMYDTSLEKWQEVDIVKNQRWLVKKLMPFHYSLLSFNN